MNGQTLYPLAPSAWGAAVEIPVINSVQAMLFSDFAEHVGTTYVDVSLEPYPLTGAWLVRRDDSILGEIEAHHRRRFDDMEHLHRSGLLPTTVAGIRLNADDGRFEVTVFLPPSEFTVPRNDAPASHVVLPSGDMMVVETQAGEFSAAELTELSPGQWLVGLEVIGSSVVATFNGRVLGTFSEADNAELSGFIHAAREAHAPATVCARAHFLEAMIGLDVCSPDSPGATCARLPAISHRNSPRNTPWTVTEFTDGTWAVTVEREHAGEVHTVEETPVAPDPATSIDFTPTTSFQAATDAYLTEVEKTRLRRENRARAGSGHHRRRK